MEIVGYKYTTEYEAIQARKLCADFYELPKSPKDETKYWVNYNVAQLNTPVFWYIFADESITEILGEPITFNVIQEILKL